MTRARIYDCKGTDICQGNGYIMAMEYIMARERIYKGKGTDI